MGCLLCNITVATDKWDTSTDNDLINAVIDTVPILNQWHRVKVDIPVLVIVYNIVTIALEQLNLLSSTLSF